MSTFSWFLSPTIILLLLLTTTNAYYYVPNDFWWYQADQYCQDVCNSRLASINSYQQQSDINKTIQSRTSPYWNSFYKDPWIGLLREASSFEWSDGSNFGFPFPWQANEPASAATLINTSSNDLTWYTKTIDNLQPFICNSCDGVLNKYGWISLDSCYLRYNTNRAIVVDSDTTNAYESANKLFNIHGGDAWIGMEIGDINDITTYIWSDGTVYDYGDGYDPTSCVGTCTPWIDNGPDGNGACVHITDDGWNTEDCVELAFALCDLPSELRMDLNAWIPVSGEWDFSDGQINMMASSREDNFIIMGDKFWYNGNKDLLIEYRFSIDFNGKLDKYAGIMIFNEDSGCGAYYISIGKHNEGVDGYYLMLYHVKGSSTVTLDYVELDFVWIDEKYYIMKVQITNNNIFQISINDNKLTYADTSNVNNVLSVSKGSGYIALFGSNSIEIKYKYLYISGTPLFVDTVFDVDICSITFNPDPITTAAPTMPTFEPTWNPTLEPTIRTVTAGTKQGFLEQFDTMTLIVGGIAIWVILLTLIVACLFCKKRRKKKQQAAEEGKDATSTQIQITNEKNQSYPHNPPPLPKRPPPKINHDDVGNNWYHNRPGHSKMHTIPSRSTVSQSVPRQFSRSASRSGNIPIRRDNSGGNNSPNSRNHSPNSRNSKYSNYSHISTNRLAIDANYRPGSHRSISRNDSLPRNNSLPRRRNRLDTDQSFDQIYEKVPTNRSTTANSAFTNPIFLDVNSRHSEEGMSSDDDPYTAGPIQPGMSLKEEDEHKLECEDKVTRKKSGSRSRNRKASGSRVARLAMAYNINSNSNLPNRSAPLQNVDSVDNLPNLPDP